MEKLIKKIRINTVLEVMTGLHIGGSSENVEIGGIDLSVIKLATRMNQPYIPGSSLKGKIRCLLEQTCGSAKVGGDGSINNLFGFSGANMPSKLIVRDSYLTKESEQMLRKSEAMDMPYTEGKWENVIDRVKGTAEHPRQIERVPAGAKFDVEFIVNIWDDDNEDAMMALLSKGIDLLELDYLGGNGSRGYGKVKFGERQISKFSIDKEYLQ